jgi:hypothetical protein
MGMRKITQVLLATASLALLGPAPSGAEPVQWEGNGHWYECVAGSYPWLEARAAADAMSWLDLPGHLATLTTAEENAFVDETFGACQSDLWLGGYQDPQYDPIPDANWHWVTGEPWDYTDWFPGEPNDYGGPEYYLNFVGHGPYWNDQSERCVLTGFVVEFEPLPIGACCFGQNCSLLTEADCTAEGGIFQGVGTDCTPNPCDGQSGAEETTWGAVKAAFRP